jgi:hypothetical protein
MNRGKYDEDDQDDANDTDAAVTVAVGMGQLIEINDNASLRRNR